MIKERWKGIGDLVAAVTSKVGIKPCGGCKERQKQLNNLIPFKRPEQARVPGVKTRVGLEDWK